jgi:ribosomal protein S11
MADKIANWVKSLHQEAVIIVFKNFGLSFKRKGQTEAGIEAKRDAFIEAFTKMNVTISTLIDTSAIPFNGCKTQKVRRKKKKHMIKHPPAIST